MKGLYTGELKPSTIGQFKENKMVLSKEERDNATKKLRESGEIHKIIEVAFKSCVHLLREK